MAGSDPILFIVTLSLLGILLIGLCFKQLKQPSIVGYIIAGIALGPFGFQILTSPEVTTSIGNFGIMLLLFFIGLEVSFIDLLKSWRVALFGTLGQIILSVGVMFLVGLFFEWSFGRSLLLGFVICLSSTAVLLRVLESRKELHTVRGRNALAILLAQDLAIVPMIIIISLFGDIRTTDPLLQIVGACLFCLILFFSFRSKQKLVLPFSKMLNKDHELQMFTALILCFGFAAISAFFGLSEALGAFFAGIIVNNIKGTEWIHDSLHSFKTLFVAIFFVSIGLLMDLSFIAENIVIVGLTVLLVLILNTFINAAAFWVLQTSWKESLYYGSLLAQIGEFSFLLAAIGLSVGLIQQYSYQLTISVIAMSLLLSPLWILLFEKLTRHMVGSEN
jgi:CPA2 family monovalent cation:H+ antiporter-2